MTATDNPAEYVVFADAYTGEEKYGRIEHRFGGDAIIHIVTKEEAGPNPKRIVPRPDLRTETLS